MARHILLMGRPGVGKTTVIRRVVEHLRGWKVGGFYTREVRSEGRRTGFEVVTLDGQTGRLATVGFESAYRVSRYGVDLDSFERVALPALEAARADLMVVDEIGKMESMSLRFRQAVERLLAGHVPVLGSVGRGGGPFMRAVRQREDVELLEVTQANRDELPRRLVRVLSEGGVTDTGGGTT